MLHVSFAMTSEAFVDGTKTETRRFWKPAHAAKFRPGVVFMGISKDFRAGGVRMHPARVLECYRERLSMMSGYSFSAEGGTRYWANREAYIEAMGGPDNMPWVLRFEHLETVKVGKLRIPVIGYANCTGHKLPDGAENARRIAEFVWGGNAGTEARDARAGKDA